jgi:hypothetical protein
MPQGKDFSAPSTIRRIPKSPWTSFCTLLAAIRNMVPSNSMDQIIEHYEKLLVCIVAQINAYFLND